MCECYLVYNVSRKRIPYSVKNVLVQKQVVNFNGIRFCVKCNFAGICVQSKLHILSFPRKHTTLFQSCSKVVDVKPSNVQRQSQYNAVYLMGLYSFFLQKAVLDDFSLQSYLHSLNIVDGRKL